MVIEWVNGRQFRSITFDNCKWPPVGSVKRKALTRDFLAEFAMHAAEVSQTCHTHISARAVPDRQYHSLNILTFLNICDRIWEKYIPIYAHDSPKLHLLHHRYLRCFPYPWTKFPRYTAVYPTISGPVNNYIRAESAIPIYGKVRPAKILNYIHSTIMKSFAHKEALLLLN